MVASPRRMVREIGDRGRGDVICHKAACVPGSQPRTGSIIARSTAHRPETRRKPRAFRGTGAKEFPILSGAKEFPILSPKCASLRMFMAENLARVSASPASDALL